MNATHYNPERLNPLKGLPREYIHETFHAMKPKESQWTVNRNNLFDVLRYRERKQREMKWRKEEKEVEEKQMLNARQIWEILIPYRPEMTRFHSPLRYYDHDDDDEQQQRSTLEQQNQCCPSYEWIINSLQCWFQNSTFSRIEYVQWSISALVTILECNQSDAIQLGAKMAQFGTATKVIEDIFKNSKKEDLYVLQRCLTNE